MSEFEIVGVVFGVLPLIISAIEDYEKIVGPITTYRQYSKALKTFTTELNVQRDIFQNECIWILSRFVEGQELEDMLKDPSHNLRSVIKQDRSLDLNVSSTVGPHYGQLRDILQLIKTSLDEIYEETKHLPEGLSRPSRTEEEPVDIRAWKSHVKQKMKLGLKKDSPNEKINDLRKSLLRRILLILISFSWMHFPVSGHGFLHEIRNRHFCAKSLLRNVMLTPSHARPLQSSVLTISQQIVRFNASWTPAQTPQDSQSSDKCLKKIQKLRAASKTLHHHLAKLWSCPTHVRQFQRSLLIESIYGLPRLISRVMSPILTPSMLWSHVFRLQFRSQECNANSKMCQVGHSANLRLCLKTSELYLNAPPKMSFDMALTYWDIDQPTQGYQVCHFRASPPSFVSRFGLETMHWNSSSIQWMDVSDLERCAEPRAASDRVDC